MKIREGCFRRVAANHHHTYSSLCLSPCSPTPPCILLEFLSPPKTPFLCRNLWSNKILVVGVRFQHRFQMWKLSKTSFWKINYKSKRIYTKLFSKVSCWLLGKQTSNGGTVLPHVLPYFITFCFFFSFHLINCCVIFCYLHQSALLFIWCQILLNLLDA